MSFAFLSRLARMLFPFQSKRSRQPAVKPRARPARRRLMLEPLEDRLLLSADLPITFAGSDFANNRLVASNYISDSSNVDLYQLTNVAVGDRITIDVEAQSIGSGLNSFIRVFDATFNELFINDDFDGRDSRLTFQATHAAGNADYFVAISSTGNTDYVFGQAATFQAGSTQGLYDLLLTRENVAVAPDLVGASFEVVQSAAVVGEQQVAIQFTIENRGGADAGAFDVEFRLSTDGFFTAAGDTLLTDVEVAGLAAGASFTGVINVALPDGVAAGDVFIGMQVDPADAVAEGNEQNNLNQRRGTDFDILRVLAAAAEIEPNDTIAQAQAQAVAVNSRTTGALTAGDVDYYRVTAPAGGLLGVRLDADFLDTRVSLISFSSGEEYLLIQSDGISGLNQDDAILQHVLIGQDYFLKVENRGVAGGAYRLDVQFTAAIRPYADLEVGALPLDILHADLDRDGVLDLVTANQVLDGVGNLVGIDLSVFFGLGDGTFRPGIQLDVGAVASFVIPVVIAADLDNDGFLDLATTDADRGVISIFYGDPTQPTHFSAMVNVPLPSPDEPRVLFPLDLAAADLNGDGVLELVTANAFPDSEVAVLFSTGARTYSAPVVYAVDGTAFALQIVDVSSDGFLDIVVAAGLPVVILVNTQSADPALMFAEAARFQGNFFASTLLVADLNRDDQPDIMATTAGGESVQVFLKTGPGGADFANPPLNFVVGGFISSLTTGDFDNDGGLDLFVGNDGVRIGTLLLNNGTATLFEPALHLDMLASQRAVTAADFDDDGKVDVAFAAASSFAGVQFGTGNGEFRRTAGIVAGDQAVSLLLADFDGDGRLDALTANQGAISQDPAAQDNVSLIPGNGDGTFLVQDLQTVAPRLKLIVEGDFNRDGRLDYASFHDSDPTFPAVTPARVIVHLGVGDGTFQDQPHILLPRDVIAVVAAQLTDDNGDGKISDLDFLDIAAASRVDNGGQDGGELLVLFGNSVGIFDIHAFPIANLQRPTDIVAGDFDGDGDLDLAVSNEDGVDFVFPDFQSIALFVNNGDPGLADKFDAPVFFDLTQRPVGLAAGQFTNDNDDDRRDNDDSLDLVVVGATDVFLLLNQRVPGDPPPAAADLFAVAGTFAITGQPTAIVVGQLNDDDLDGSVNDLDRLDVAVAADENNGARVALFFNTGNANPANLFGPENLSFTNFVANSLAIGDVNADLIPDIITLDGGFLTVLINDVNGELNDSRSLPPNESHATPFLAEINGDGFVDALQLDGSGQVLFRAGTAVPGVFEAPAVVNPERPARDATVFVSTRGIGIATLDRVTNAVSLYSFLNDRFERFAGPAIEAFNPARLEAGDLDGDGFDELVVTNTGNDSVGVFVFDQFLSVVDELGFDVGLGPVELDLVDIDGDTDLDILAVNKVSGDLSLLRNLGNLDFAAEERFRAGAGPYETELNGSDQFVFSREGSSALAVGDFLGDARLDVLVANAGTDTLGLLEGGSLFNPRVFALNPAVRIAQLRAGSFNADAFLDIVVLDDEENEVRIFLGDGQGNFTLSFTAPAGNFPTGIAVADVDGDTFLDVLLGNEAGDLLILLGNGDGTLDPFVRSGRSIPLATADIDGDGFQDALIANESLDRITVQYRDTGADTFTPDNIDDRTNPFLLGPSAVQIEDLNFDGFRDLVVATGGSNSVLVYLGTADAHVFENPRKFFAGTNPVAVTVADVNSDTVFDLVVANQGSNDVSILLGRGDGLAWTMEPGPRLTAGTGPVTTEVGDFNFDGFVDLLVTNQGSDDVFLIPGVGGGFFDDTTPTVFDLTPFGGVGPGDLDLGDFNGNGTVDFVTSNFGSSNFTFFDNFGIIGAVGVTVAFGGVVGPVQTVVGDFNFDGADDLVIGSDGLLSLVLGGDTFNLVDQEALGFLDPSDVAFSALAGGSIDLYVTREGVENVFLFSLDITGGLGENITELTGLEGSEVASIATILTVTDRAGGATDDASALGEDAELNAFVIGLGDPTLNGGSGGAANWDEGVLGDILAFVRDYVRKNAPTLVAAILERLEPLSGVASTLEVSLAALDSSLRSFGWRGDLVGQSWQDTLVGLYQGGLSVGDALEQIIRTQFLGMQARGPRDAYRQHLGELTAGLSLWSRDEADVNMAEVGRLPLGSELWRAPLPCRPDTEAECTPPQETEQDVDEFLRSFWSQLPDRLDQHSARSSESLELLVRSVRPDEADASAQPPAIEAALLDRLLCTGVVLAALPAAPLFFAKRNPSQHGKSRRSSARPARRHEVGNQNDLL